MTFKIALLLSYLVFSTNCMAFGCILHAVTALKTIGIVWLTVSIFVFVLVARFMWFSGAKNNKIAESCIQPEVEPDSTFEKFDLTKRELEILYQLCDGKTNTQIANTLYISESTVKTHVSNAYRKLGVRNRVEAVSFFNSLGVK